MEDHADSVAMTGAQSAHKHELAAREVFLRLRQQNRHLERKDMLAVQVLVQRVEVALAVLQ